MFEYGFVENIDYLTIGQKCPIANGGYKMKTNHYIKMDMAKEISMIQRNEKGKQARQFYSCCKLLIFLFAIKMALLICKSILPFSPFLITLPATYNKNRRLNNEKMGAFK